MAFKKLISEIWKFLWKEDSILSWIVSLILAFIIVKFVFFPLLSLAFATSLPLVVVESSSMHHSNIITENVIGSSIIGKPITSQNIFNQWWAEHSNWYLENSINKEKTNSWDFKNGLEIGDIVLVSGRSQLKIGDIIIFNAKQAYPIIHRIIKITEVNGKKVYSTKGDNNPDQLYAEKEISESQILGKAIFKIPKLGWVKLFFVKLFQ